MFKVIGKFYCYCFVFKGDFCDFVILLNGVVLFQYFCYCQGCILGKVGILRSKCQLQVSGVWKLFFEENCYVIGRYYVEVGVWYYYDFCFCCFFVQSCVCFKYWDFFGNIQVMGVVVQVGFYYRVCGMDKWAGSVQD